MILKLDILNKKVNWTPESLASIKGMTSSMNDGDNIFIELRKDIGVSSELDVVNFYREWMLPNIFSWFKEKKHQELNSKEELDFILVQMFSKTKKSIVGFGEVTVGIDAMSTQDAYSYISRIIISLQNEGLMMNIKSITTLLEK